MAFDVYDLNDYQVELGYFALDKGKAFSEGKFLRLSKDDFIAKPSGEGLLLLQEGLDTGMIRSTKSGAFALVAKQVQQVVSVYDRPRMEPVKSTHTYTDKDPHIQSPQYVEKEYDDDSESILSKFDELNNEDTSNVPTVPSQPILTYLGAGLAIVAMIISSFISPTGFVGLFTVILSLIGAIMTVVGTIQFFRKAHAQTSKNSKILHILLTVISFATFLMMSYTFFVVGPKVAEPVLSEDEQVVTLRQEKPGEFVDDSSKESSSDKVVEAAQLEDTVSLEHDVFVKESDTSGIMVTSLPVSITNTSDTVWTYDITVQAYNVNGDKVGSPDFVLLLTVEPGETVERTVFEYVTGEEADILSQKEMSFKISNIVVS